MLMALTIRLEVEAREMWFRGLFSEGLRLGICFLCFSPGGMIRGWMKSKTTLIGVWMMSMSSATAIRSRTNDGVVVEKLIKSDVCYPVFSGLGLGFELIEGTCT